jgi:hypothetical protein
MSELTIGDLLVDCPACGGTGYTEQPFGYGAMSSSQSDARPGFGPKVIASTGLVCSRCNGAQRVPTPAGEAIQQFLAHLRANHLL